MLACCLTGGLFVGVSHGALCMARPADWRLVACERLQAHALMTDSCDCLHAVQPCTGLRL